MRGSVATAVAVAVVVATVAGTVAAVGGPGVTGAGPDGGAEVARAGPGGAGPAPASYPGDGAGTNLSVVLASERAALAGELDASVYAGRLAAAGTDRERARTIDRKLSEVAALLEEIGRRRETLLRARENGSITGTGYRTRAARLAETLVGVRRVLDRSEAAAAALPADRRREYDIPSRIDAQRSRADALLSGELAAAARQARGSDRAAETAPLDYAAIRAAFEGGDTEMPGTLRPVFGSERITVVVERANGTTAVFGLWTSGGEVVKTRRTPPADPTLVVRTDYATVGEVRRADDSWAATERAVADGRIRYRGVGVLNTVKYGTVSVGLALYDGAAWVAGGVADFVGGVVGFVR